MSTQETTRKMLNHPIIHNQNTVPFNKTIEFHFHNWLAHASGIDYWAAREFSSGEKLQYLWFNPLTGESEIVTDAVGTMLNFMKLDR